VVDWYFVLEPDAQELQVGMDLFRFGLISGHDRMSGVGSLEDAAMDILGSHDLRRPHVFLV
jgi:hypothetical protein